MKRFLFLLWCFVFLQAAKANGWSMETSKSVFGYLGTKVTLPCTIKHPISNYNGSITVIWRKETFGGGPIIFQCLTTYSTDTNGSHCVNQAGDAQEIGRYMLAGNPWQNDLSLLINNLTYNDRSKYFCRFQLTRKVDAFEGKTGTELLIKGPPSINHLSASVDRSGVYSVVCKAEELPLTNITLVEHGNMNSSPTRNNQSAIKMGEVRITAVRSGTYTCVTINEFGKEERTIQFGIPAPESKSSAAERGNLNTITIVCIVISGVLFGIIILLGILLIKKNQAKNLNPERLIFSKTKPASKFEESDADQIYVNVSQMAM
ncbi:sialic acid-binding Ig-like lectin 15 isoform X1 [Acipenser ruthenus]|uniref:sialic acid-binding Ig-like lectin 15 isoform X1 n=1 Tax=Acipenser ruthenus TaxID=7906 RepID=UPI002741EADB|nr:sialic acid-binding Ig-like lectin 15 isoform X1 [Acipenser ruthenus]